MNTFTIYMAGLFDADGWVNIEKKKSRTPPRYNLNVGFNMCLGEALQKAHSQWGGYLKYFDNPGRKITHRPYWRWQVQARKAVVFLKAVEPFLILKKERVELALRFQNHLSEAGKLRYQKGKAGFQHLPDDIMQEREDFYQQMKLLNSRGVKVQA